MNICFLIGKIISEIEFKFILNSKNISIAIFEIELKNKSIVKIKAYNDLADYCYRELIKSDYISIVGYLCSKGEVEIIEYEIL